VAPGNARKCAHDSVEFYSIFTSAIYNPSFERTDIRLIGSEYNNAMDRGRKRVLVKRPVLLLGFVPRIIIPIARSLRRHGVPVDVASFRGSPGVYSTAIHECRSFPRPDLDGKEFIRQLRRFIVERGHDMLIPTDDWMLTAVVQHYDDLADLLHIGCPPPAVTRLVLDKTATLRIAQSCGIQIPTTAVVSSSSQLRDHVGGFPFPWIVKPAQRETRTEEMKSCILTSADEVEKAFPVGREFTPPLLVQQYCAGVGVGVEILMHHGECVAVFQHRRLKELPYTGGFSVTAVAEAVNESLMQRSLALLHALRWDGVAMVEYRVDTSGRAVLMEVNGRYWGTISLPIFAGLNFPLYHWQLVHGERPQIPANYAVGAKWRWTAGYLGRLYFLLAKARHSAEAREVLRKDLRQLLEDFSPSVSDAILTSSDPMPSMVEFLQTTQYYASYSTRRVLERLGPAESASFKP
jgi:predicted ATP-grasp superfamily ATP-dependent carboligase